MRPINIFNIIAGIVTIISGLITIFNFFDNATLKIIIKTTFIIFLVLTFVSLIYFWFYKKWLCKIGVKGEPLSFKLFLKKFNPVITSYFAREIHLFHHELVKAKNDVILNDLKTPNCNEGKEISANLLRRCQDILRIITGVDFSLNIKLFEKLDSSDEGIENLENAVLMTYERYSSVKEKERIQNDLPKRNNTEKFIIARWEKHEENNLINIVKSYNGKYKKNFAYDFVFGPTKHYWLSNNLTKNIESNNFYSTSNNFYKYYKSLGVFLLSPPLEAGEHVAVDKVLGIIILDAFENNIFHKKYIRDLMGYFAHRFYEYFMSYSILNN